VWGSACQTGQRRWSESSGNQSAGPTKPAVAKAMRIIIRAPGLQRPERHDRTETVLALMARAKVAQVQREPWGVSIHSVSVMPHKVYAAHTLSKPAHALSYDQSSLSRTRPVRNCPPMAKTTYPASGGDPREQFRREVGERLRNVRRLYDTNRTRFTESFVKGDKGERPIHHTTWKGWEDGYSLADVEVMVEFCKRTGVTLDWLYRGVIDGVDEDVRLRMFAADPKLLAWYQADRASQRAAAPDQPVPPAPPPPPPPTQQAPTAPPPVPPSQEQSKGGEPSLSTADILDRLPEEVRLKLFMENPKILAAYIEARSARRDTPPEPPASPEQPTQVKPAPPLPAAPSRGRRRRGKRAMPERIVAGLR
jgi:hypothetical protein